MTDPFVIKNAKDIAMPWTHWFLYGPSGSGKTTAASTFPNPLFLVPAAEGSELTLAGLDVPYIKIGRDAANGVVKPREHMMSVLKFLGEQHDKMRQCLAKGDEAGAIEAFPWETIVCESMTHYCSMLQDDIGNNGAIKMDQQRWGLMADHLRMLHARLRTFECHVVFTALAKVEGEGNAVEGAADISGKMARLMPSACDAIGFCEVVESTSARQPPTYRVHFRQHRVYPARTRFRGMPAVIENFNFAEVQQYTMPSTKA